MCKHTCKASMYKDYTKVLNHLPEQTGVPPLHSPTTVCPSPSQVLFTAPSRKNPSLQEYVATVLNSYGAISLYIICPFVIGSKSEQEITKHRK